MNGLIEQTFASLTDAATATTQVRQLGELCDSDLPLQPFLEHLLPQICQMYQAPAAVAWLKTQGAVFGVRFRMERLLSTISQQKNHERMVQVVWSRKLPTLAEPTGKGGQNPTDHPLLFAPILHLDEPVALLEIVLPVVETAIAESAKQVLLRSAQLVAQRVYGGLKRRMAMPLAQVQRAVAELHKLSSDLTILQQQIQVTLENRLAQFQGWSFGSIAENQEFAKLLHQILDSHGLRVVCTECGHPAILRCLRAGNAKHGVFVFDHYLDSGRTFHGGPTTVPTLKVTAKPARRSISQAND